MPSRAIVGRGHKRRQPGATGGASHWPFVGLGCRPRGGRPSQEMRSPLASVWALALRTRGELSSECPCGHTHTPFLAPASAVVVCPAPFAVQSRRIRMLLGASSCGVQLAHRWRAHTRMLERRAGIAAAGHPLAAAAARTTPPCQHVCGLGADLRFAEVEAYRSDRAAWLGGCRISSHRSSSCAHLTVMAYCAVMRIPRLALLFVVF